MNCKHVQEKLVDYLKQELDNTVRQQFNAHLGTCENCARELAGLQSLWQDLDQGAMHQPSARTRDRFYAMLNQHLARQQAAASARPDWRSLFRSVWPSRPQWALAYSFLVVLGGFILGRLLPVAGVAGGPADPQQEIARIRDDVSDLRDMVALNMLSQASVQERLQGIDYARQSGAGDTRVLSLLLNTLERDDTRNVRLAALDALAPHLDNPMVRERLYNSLLQESSPIVQLKVVELLVKAAGDDAPGLVDELTRAGILDTEVERYLHDRDQEMI